MFSTNGAETAEFTPRKILAWDPVQKSNSEGSNNSMQELQMIKQWNTALLWIQHAFNDYLMF